MSKHIATTTQGEHPWRAVIRTILALIGAIASAAPLIYVAISQQSPEAATGAAAQVLAVAAAITRVLALPVVEQFLQRFLPWLAASARGDEESAITQPETTDTSDAYPISDEHEPTQSPARE